MIIKLLIDGGSMTPGPAVAQQLGPMGVNMGKVISDVNEATKEFKGMKVPVELDINEKTKEFTVKTSSPPTSELLKKELKLEKGTADHKNDKVGNASIEDIIKVTKIKFPQMLEKDFKTAVKSILGTCTSIGIFVENEAPIQLTEKINQGKFDKEINEKSTETSPEKRSKLDKFFKAIKSAQDAKAAEVAAEAAEAEAKSAEGAEGAEGEAPAEGAEGAESPAGESTESKTEEKSE